MDSRDKKTLENLKRKLELKNQYLLTCRPRSCSFKVTVYDIESLEKQIDKMEGKIERKHNKKQDYDNDIKLSHHKINETVEVIEKLKLEQVDNLTAMLHLPPNLEELTQRNMIIAEQLKSLNRSKINLERAYIRKLNRHSYDSRTVAMKIKDAQNKVNIEFIPTPIKAEIVFNPLDMLNSNSNSEPEITSIEDVKSQEEQAVIQQLINNGLDFNKTKKDIMEPDWQAMMTGASNET